MSAVWGRAEEFGNALLLPLVTDAVDKGVVMPVEQ
jgi:hypothetical protein